MIRKTWNLALEMAGRRLSELDWSKPTPEPGYWEPSPPSFSMVLRALDGLMWRPSR